MMRESSRLRADSGEECSSNYGGCIAVTFREIQEKMMRVYSSGSLTSVTSGLCGALNIKGLSEEAIREGVGFKVRLLRNTLDANVLWNCVRPSL